MAEVATEYLWYVNPEQDESLYVAAALALRRGDPTEFDIVDALWRREGRSDEEMNRLRARSWLDVGDPVQAYEELRRGGSKLKRGADSRVLMAETLRRLGLIADAERSLANKLMGSIDGADADAVKARMLVDQGRLGEARELLSGYTMEMGEDVVASRWYLARAEGNTAEMEREAAVFGEVRNSPSRALEQYIPLPDAR
jgi:predicted Zn-dependent protease